MTTVRPVELVDIQTALRLWQVTSPLQSRGVESEAGLERFLARNVGCSQLVCVGAEVVGVAICGHDGRRGYLHHVGVLAAHRRRGLGHRLIEACLAALHAEKISRVHVQLKLENSAGLKFWKSLGCRERKDTATISLRLKSNEFQEGRDDS